jgi:hypothetical protein
LYEQEDGIFAKLLRDSGNMDERDYQTCEYTFRHHLLMMRTLDWRIKGHLDRL